MHAAPTNKLDVQLKSQLQQLGLQLDVQIFPRVKNGGIVSPSDLDVPSILGEEKDDEHETRSTTRARQGAQRREGTAGGPRAAGQAASVLGPSLQAQYEDELAAVLQTYPGARVWRQSDGLWLLTESGLLPGLQQAATFLTGISFTRGTVRSWGFWRRSVLGFIWIGPRHTNFPDGSVCAFHPLDGTWSFGDSIIELLDLYTVWALRHLHLEVFGQWPGPQAAHHPYERMAELQPEEHCGCGSKGLRYADCCYSSDMARDRVADAVSFIIRSDGGRREPPNAIVRAVRGDSEPPPLTSLLE